MKKLIVFAMFLFMLGCGRPYIPLFEGNCVDRAVKIRQHLIEKGYEAKLILGITPAHNKAHCWVRYRNKENGEWVEHPNYYEVRELDRRLR